MPTPFPNLAAVLSASLDAVVVIEDTGLVVDWNSNAERIFGYSRAEAMHRQIAELIIPVDARAAHLHGMVRYLDFGEIRIVGTRTKLSALHKDGHEIPVEIAVMVYSGIGNRRFLGFIRDLTKEAADAAQIATLNAEVLQVSRLNAMGTAASMLAHELNQPLAAANNYLAGCHQLANQSKFPQQVDLIGGILKAQDAIRRAAGAVEAVREIVGKRPMPRSKIRLQILMDNSISLLGSNLPIKPVFEMDPEAKYVSVDQGQVEQVLLNIMRNAIEAIHGLPNPILVCSSNRKGDEVEVCIRDNGPGLSDEARKHLFNPFRSTKETGLGIGLSICRSIIEEQGGKLWAKSDGFGTAFCFTLQGS